MKIIEDKCFEYTRKLVFNINEFDKKTQVKLYLFNNNVHHFVSSQSTIWLEEDAAAIIALKFK